MTQHTLRHFNTEYYQKIENSSTYEELHDVAIDVLKNMPKPLTTLIIN